MRSPLRIAVLECDTPLEKIRAKYGGYGSIFEILLRAGAKRLNQPDKIDPQAGLKITSFNVVDGEEYPSLEDVDAILLSGSKHDAFDDNPWILRLVEFVRIVLAQDRVRLIGVCFGHQIIARALGAKIGRSDKGWEIAVNDVELTEKGKEIFKLPKLRIQQMHRDIVSTCPPGIELLGTSPACAVQGFYDPKRLITVQGHPEFTGDIMTEIVTARHNMGIFTDDMYKDALPRATFSHDGVDIAAAFLEFAAE